MPWKEPGKGGQDPWKQGEQPPDLDEVFARVRDRLSGLFGNGRKPARGGGSTGGSNAGLWPLALLFLGGWIAWDSFYIVDEAERGVIKRFGKYVREEQPGFNFKFPAPIESLDIVNVGSVRSIEDEGHMLTKDETLVEFDYKVQYRVSNAQDFLFRVRDPELTLLQAAESALRESVGTNRLDRVLEGKGRDEVRLQTQRSLQETLDQYGAGLQITEFNLVDVNVPLPVREAYSDVIRAREDRERFIEEARVHANSVIPEARGSAARILQEAQGYRDSVVALADGEADRFKAQLFEYKLAPDITRKRMYLQAMEGVLGSANLVLLDVDSGGNILYLPLDGLKGSGSDPARLPVPVAPERSVSNNPERDASTRTTNRESRQ